MKGPRYRHQSWSTKLSACRKVPQEDAEAPLGIVLGLQANLFASIIHSKDLSNLQMRVHLLVQEAGRRVGVRGVEEGGGRGAAACSTAVRVQPLAGDRL